MICGVIFGLDTMTEDRQAISDAGNRANYSIAAYETKRAIGRYALEITEC
jgi:hypothetical protein